MQAVVHYITYRRCYTTNASVRWDYCDPSPVPACEPLGGNNGAGYRGCQNKTRSGRDCQSWGAQAPHAHRYSPQDYLSSGLDANFCRNPAPNDTTIVTIWCYTTDPAVRWDYCNPRMCLLILIHGRLFKCSEHASSFRLLQSRGAYAYPSIYGHKPAGPGPVLFADRSLPLVRNVSPRARTAHSYSVVSAGGRPLS